MDEPKRLTLRVVPGNLEASGKEFLLEPQGDMKMLSEWNSTPLCLRFT